MKKKEVLIVCFLIIVALSYLGYKYTDHVSVNNRSSSTKDSKFSSTIRQLENLNITVEPQPIDYQQDEGQIVHIYDIKDDQIIYSIQQKYSDDNYDLLSLNTYNLTSHEINVLQDLQDCHQINDSILYDGKALYVEQDPSTQVSYLKYGEDILFTSLNSQTHIAIYYLHDIYVFVEDYSSENYGTTIYTFTGTLKQVGERMGTFDYNAVIDNGHSIVLNWYNSFEAYMNKDGSLINKEVMALVNNPEAVSIVGTYMVYDSAVYNLNTDQEITLDILYLEDGKINEDGGIFENNIVNIMDIGKNNTFLFKDNDTNKLYKAIINEDEGCILYEDTGEILDANVIHYNKDEVLYAYKDVSLFVNSNQSGATLSKITISFNN